MKKGFTLIELLAVIIILAIIALIAMPMVFNVIDDVKKSSARTEAIHIVDGVNLNCQLSEFKVTQGTITADENPCADKVITDAELKTMVDKGNYTSASIAYDGSKVTAATIVTNGYTVTYDGSTYSLSK